MTNWSNVKRGLIAVPVVALRRPQPRARHGVVVGVRLPRGLRGSGDRDEPARRLRDRAGSSRTRSGAGRSGRSTRTRIVIRRGEDERQPVPASQLERVEPELPHGLRARRCGARHGRAARSERDRRRDTSAPRAPPPRGETEVERGWRRRGGPRGGEYTNGSETPTGALGGVVGGTAQIARKRFAEHPFQGVVWTAVDGVWRRVCERPWSAVRPGRPCILSARLAFAFPRVAPVS